MTAEGLIAVGVGALSCLGFATLMLPAGLVSFGHAIYGAVGGWVVAAALRQGGSGTWVTHWPMETLPVLAGAGAAICAAALSMVAARHAGAAFAMISLGLAEAAAQWAVGSNRWGGEGGWSLDRHAAASILSTDLPQGATGSMVLTTVWCLGLSAALLAWALRGRRVLLWAALRDDEERLQALGHSAWAWRSALLVLSAVPMGLGAGVQVLWVERFSAAAWQTEHSVWLMVFGVSGVAVVQRWPRLRDATLWVQVLAAGVLGGCLMAAAQQWLPRLSSLWPLVLGLAFVLICATGRAPSAPLASSLPLRVRSPREHAQVDRSHRSGEEVLRLEQLTLSYGQVAVLRGIDLVLHRGECVALVGPNGAGKSSLFEVLSARVRPQGGRQWWQGQLGSSHSVAQRARSGVARSFQGSRLFDSLTPAAHVALLPSSVPADAAWVRLRSALGVADDWDRPVGQLGTVARRAVEVLLTLSQPADLVLLDEPTAGLNPVQTRQWVRALAEWRQHQSHQGWLLIEHDASVVQGLADRVLRMEQGRLQPAMADAEPRDEPLNDGSVPVVPQGPTRLRASIPGADVTLAAGQCLAVLGPAGAGRSRLLRTWMGLLPAQGSLSLDGQELTQASAVMRSRAGMAWVPEDRGLWLDLSVAEHLRLAVDRRPDTPIGELQQAFPALAERWEVPAGQLSGGERQMLALARAAALRPHLLLLDEPSEGLSSMALQDTLRRLQSACQGGMALVLTEQKLSLAPALADQVLVLDRGGVVWYGRVRPGAWPADLHQHLQGLGITPSRSDTP